MKFKNFRIPNWTNATEMTTYKGGLFLQYMKERALANRVGAGQTVVAYTHGATCVANAYWGGVLNADGSRIYLVPYKQSTAAVWHYIRTSDGVVVPYTHGATCVATAYNTGVLVPNGRIYLIPYSQSTAAVWHYIDTDGTVKAYTHGATCVAGAYLGGSIQPNTGRIYFAPMTQATAAVWHYIRTSDGVVVPYTHGVTTTAKLGGVTATNGRVYFIQSSRDDAAWHYIDTDGSVISYSHTDVIPTYYRANDGGVLHPSTGRIYTVPTRQGSIYYIDPNITPGTTGHVVALADTWTAGEYSYVGGALGSNGRIYFAPSVQATVSVWHYIDVDGTVVAYSHGATCVAYAYSGGCLAPDGKIYLVPYGQATAAVWHYIDITPDNDFSENVCTSPYLNKF